jgi:hypothetical protein
MTAIPSSRASNSTASLIRILSAEWHAPPCPAPLKIRMGDGDQAPRALGERLALEFGRAEFRDDHIHIAACGRDRPGQAPGSDAADLAPLAVAGKAMMERPPGERLPART